MQIKISIPHADKPQNTEVIEDRRDSIWLRV
jgi:hypothetical protein